MVFGKEYYVRYHHVFGHNLLFAAIVTLVSIRWVGTSIHAWGRVFLCFLLHFAGDYWGSGPGWPLYVYWPFSDEVLLNPRAWEFNGWQSQIVFWSLMVVTVLIARRHGRSPFEAVGVNFDRSFVNSIAARFGAPCKCGAKAANLCVECALPLCNAHASREGLYVVRCESCAVRDGAG